MEKGTLTHGKIWRLLWKGISFQVTTTKICFKIWKRRDPKEPNLNDIFCLKMLSLEYNKKRDWLIPKKRELVKKNEWVQKKWSIEKEEEWIKEKKEIELKREIEK